jgi:hypothetical protein
LPHGLYGSQPLVHLGNPRFALALRDQRLASFESCKPHLVPKPLLGREGE